MRILFFLCLCNILACKAQNTLALEEGQASPPATLETITWMEGHWQGNAFGGITEEIWGPPLGGSMMFVFKHVINGSVNFYEIGHIREIGGTLVFELKHFDGSLKGWEEKDEALTFKLVKVDGDRVYFEGFTFEKVTENEINIYGLIGNDDGTANEVTFNYKRVNE
ncbi:MAG: DUF6265 family protein [Flavobacteriaceae bacterium]